MGVQKFFFVASLVAIAFGCVLPWKGEILSRQEIIDLTSSRYPRDEGVRQLPAPKLLLMRLPYTEIASDRSRFADKHARACAGRLVVNGVARKFDIVPATLFESCRGKGFACHLDALDTLDGEDALLLVIQDYADVACGATPGAVVVGSMPCMNVESGIGGFLIDAQSSEQLAFADAKLRKRSASRVTDKSRSGLRLWCGCQDGLDSVTARKGLAASLR